MKPQTPLTEDDLQRDPAGSARRLLAACGLEGGPLEPMAGWSNQIWASPTHVVRISSGRFAGGLGYEARVLGALAHADCPRVVAAGEIGRREWMVQARLPGISLLTAWPGLTWDQRERAVRSLARTLRQVHQTPLRPDLLDPPWRAAALGPGGDRAAAYRLAPADYPILIEANLRRGTAAPALLADVGAFIEARLGLFGGDVPALTHGDASFANVVWDGERASLVDFESAGAAPRDRELDMLLRFLAAPPDFSPRGEAASPEAFGPVAGWLCDAYPELWAHSALPSRLAVYDALWELVQLLNHPADHPRRGAARLRLEAVLSLH